MNGQELSGFVFAFGVTVGLFAGVVASWWARQHGEKRRMATDRLQILDFVADRR